MPSRPAADEFSSRSPRARGIAAGSRALSREVAVALAAGAGAVDRRARPAHRAPHAPRTVRAAAEPPGQSRPLRDHAARAGDKDLATADAVIGTGPFVLRTYERGVRAVYDRKPDYRIPAGP
jgi:hypothetical protein